MAGKDKVTIDDILSICYSKDIHADQSALNYLQLLSYNLAINRGVLDPNSIIIDYIANLNNKDQEVETI